MAQQSLIGGAYTPNPWAFGNAAPTYSATLAIDASGEKVAIIFTVLKTGTLDLAGFRLGAVTTAENLKISFQDVDPATGDADGVVDQYRVITSGITANTWVTPGLMTSDGTDGGTKRSVTRGDKLAIVIEFDSAVGNLVISSITGINTASLLGGSYTGLYTGTWAKQAVLMPVVALKYSDGTYVYCGPDVLPASAVNLVVFNSGSTPDEQGLYFQIPVPRNIGGAMVRVDADGDFDLVLYDSDGTTVIASRSIDKDVRAAATGINFPVFFAADHLLTAATNYRLVVKPTSVTSLVTYNFEVATAAMLDGVAGGQLWHYTSRTDAGAWTQTTTKRPCIHPWFTSADDATGGGGGTTGIGVLVGGGLVR